MIDGDAPENQPSARSQCLEAGEHIVPLLAPVDFTLLPALLDAAEEHGWLLEARLSALAQGLALATRLQSSGGLGGGSKL